MLGNPSTSLAAFAATKSAVARKLGVQHDSHGTAIRTIWPEPRPPRAPTVLDAAGSQRLAARTRIIAWTSEEDREEALRLEASEARVPLSCGPVLRVQREEIVPARCTCGATEGRPAGAAAAVAASCESATVTCARTTAAFMSAAPLLSQHAALPHGCLGDQTTDDDDGAIDVGGRSPLVEISGVAQVGPQGRRLRTALCTATIAESNWRLSVRDILPRHDILPRRRPTPPRLTAEAALVQWEQSWLRTAGLSCGPKAEEGSLIGAHGCADEGGENVRIEGDQCLDATRSSGTVGATQQLPSVAPLGRAATLIASASRRAHELARYEAPTVRGRPAETTFERLGAAAGR